jgi:Xaa-Pro dipeptidase
MSRAAYAHFPPDEYRARVARMREALDRHDLDAAIVTSKENVIYFSGLRTVSWISKHRLIATVIPRDPSHQVVSIVPESLLEVALASSWVEDVRPWGGWREKGAEPDVIAAIARVCDEYGAGTGRIGIEIGYGHRNNMTQEQLEGLRLALPKATIDDAGAALWDVRLIKSEHEIAAIREACRATDCAFDKVFGELRPGVTERELAGIILAEIVTQTGEPPGFVMIRSGVEKYGMVNVEPFERKLERGDLVVIDIGAQYKSYWSDFMRMACIGEPTAEQRRFFDAELAAQEAGVNALAPGVPLERAFEASYAVLLDAGLEEHVPGMERVGHGLGLDVHEPPSIGRGSSDIAQPGMVLTIEPIFWDRPDHRIGNFALEDDILVTEDGVDVLSKTPKELHIVG